MGPAVQIQSSRLCPVFPSLPHDSQPRQIIPPVSVTAKSSRLWPMTATHGPSRLCPMTATHAPGCANQFSRLCPNQCLGAASASPADVILLPDGFRQRHAPTQANFRCPILCPELPLRKMTTHSPGALDKNLLTTSSSCYRRQLHACLPSHYAKTSSLGDRACLRDATSNANRESIPT